VPIFCPILAEFGQRGAFGRDLYLPSRIFSAGTRKAATRRRARKGASQALLRIQHPDTDMVKSAIVTMVKRVTGTKLHRLCQSGLDSAGDVIYAPSTSELK
jgi:hypothetical protein